MRIQKDMENKYRFEIDAKTLENEKLSDQLAEIKRLYEVEKQKSEY